MKEREITACLEYNTLHSCVYVSFHSPAFHEARIINVEVRHSAKRISA